MINAFGYRCPNCGNTRQIDVCAEVWVRLTTDGTDVDAAAISLSMKRHALRPDEPHRYPRSAVKAERKKRPFGFGICLNHQTWQSA